MQIAVNAPVYSFFSGFVWLSANGRCDPLLELVLIALREITRASIVPRYSMNFELDTRKRFLQAPFNKCNSKVSYINANPRSPEFLCSINRCPAAAKWISTRSPSRDDAFKIRSSSARGFWVG